MRAVVHIHQQLIRKGEPAVIIRTYKGSEHASHVRITGPIDLIQTAEPDSCGARVAIHCQRDQIEVVT
jgi:hypothetical protein